MCVCSSFSDLSIPRSGLALGLGLSEEFFEPFYSNPFHLMRLMHYPGFGALRERE